jgi:hypothetical protein
MDIAKLSSVRRRRAPGIKPLGNPGIPGRSVDDLVAAALKRKAKRTLGIADVESKIEAAKAQLRRG